MKAMPQMAVTTSKTISHQGTMLTMMELLLKPLTEIERLAA